MKAWIDIDNPPQVQYLAPFVDAFQRRGFDVLVTARDYGITTQLLDARGIPYRALGRQFGSSTFEKLRGTAGRACRLLREASNGGRPRLLLSTSRSAAMAAWMLRIPSFMVLDYEHAELRSFRRFGTTVLYPDVIDAEAFLSKGFPARSLIPFNGIKEDISFAGRDTEGATPHDFGGAGDGVVRILVRPPSETSHYFDAGTRDLNQALLALLAQDAAVQIVFAPRDPDQIRQLDAHAWRNPPIVLERPVEFVALLKAVDWVVCAGGTMLREAAYLGVPAVSTFRSEVGAVDRWMESLGAVRLVDRAEDLELIDWLATATGVRLPRNGELVEELTDVMIGRLSSTTR